MKSNRMKSERCFPWQNAMQFGLGILHLSSEKFWAMTPRELDAAYRANSGSKGFSGPIERQNFEQLMAQFPDRQTNQCKEPNL